MANFVEKLKKFEDFTQLGGVSKAEIEDAEKQLGLKFAKDYKEYLQECGAATANAHEFTGLCDSKRLDVVLVTEKLRRQDKFFDSAYVIEDTNMDGVIVWQTSKGEIYESQGNNVEEIAKSLAEYFEV